ncbi:MAG: hypothetical protein WEE89_15870 [Gemmatimonadota bacterium]
MTDLAFVQEVERVIVVYEKAIGHYASRTRQMIEQHGEVGALSRLMVSADLQQGFKVLRDSGQLDETFEAVIVRHRHLFGPDAVDVAQWRLANPHQLFN